MAGQAGIIAHDDAGVFRPADEGAERRDMYMRAELDVPRIKR